MSFQTDAINSSALPVSTLGKRRPPPPLASVFDNDNNAAAGPSSDPDKAAREKFHEDWNVRIDKEVRSLAGGLRELVDLADVRSDNETSPAGQYATIFILLILASVRLIPCTDWHESFRTLLRSYIAAPAHPHGSAHPFSPVPP
jgi:hypothetical protein